MDKKRKKFGLEIAKQAGEKLFDNFRSQAARKRGTSKEVESVMDEVADEMIKKGIEEEFPADSYLTEESGLEKKEGRFLWIVDPLDGTGNFENHNPFFSVSVALWENNEPVFSVIEAPALKERFLWTPEERSIRCDLITGEREELKVSEVESLYGSYFIFCEGKEKSKNRLISNFGEIYSQVKDFRKIGSAALELCWIATGRAEGYVTYKIPLWDIAAGLPILKEAGGELYNFKKEHLEWSDFDPKKTVNLLAVNGKIPLEFNLE